MKSHDFGQGGLKNLANAYPRGVINEESAEYAMDTNDTKDGSNF